VKASPHQPSDKRQSTLRRNFNDLFMRDGQMEESKFWANVGKALCAWLIITHPTFVHCVPRPDKEIHDHAVWRIG
jgi:hypothetical protein